MAPASWKGHSLAALKRHFSDDEDLSRYRPDLYLFDPEAVDRVNEFFERFIKHAKGEWAGQPFIPEKWQKAIVRDLFGWKRKQDGLRKHRRCYVEVPRKNGKSTLAAGIALYLTFADAEPGAEIYSAAADRDQAEIVFGVAKDMVNQSSVLLRRAEVFRRSIFVHKWGSIYKILSADVKTKHGLNAHGVIFDELHAQDKRDLYEVLRTASASRRQPVMFAMTTAGYDETSICYEEHSYAKKVLDGIFDDPTLLPVIYCACDEEIKDADGKIIRPPDDWKSEETWKKANPNYEISVKADYIRAEVKKAEESPAYLNAFKRLHLNIWTRQHTVWMPMDKWNACAAAIEAPPLGAEAFGGLDLASVQDLAALVWILPHRGEEPLWFDILARFWIPEETVPARVRKDHVPYDVWVKDGLIQTTPGNITDYDFIKKTILEDVARFRVEEIAYDSWNSSQLVVDLTKETALQKPDGNSRMVPFSQSFASMAGPTKELLTYVLGRRIRHGGNSVLTWMASNVTARQDPNGNWRPDRANSKEKIDGIVALIMALGRALLQETPGSVYDERDLRVL